MAKGKLHNRIELSIYERIIKGDLRPQLSKYDIDENRKDFVKQLNKVKINKKESEKLFDIDFKSLGFYSESDFEVIKEQNYRRNKVEQYIVPTKYYQLDDSEKHQSFKSPKVNDYLVLIFDEFERIKIRIDYAHETIAEKGKIEIYARKNIQKALSLIQTSKVKVSSLPIENRIDSIHILSITSIYLIKTIEFIQNIFKHILKQELEDTQSLLLELHSHAFKLHKKIFSSGNVFKLIPNMMLFYEEKSDKKSLKKSSFSEVHERLFQGFNNQELTKSEGNKKLKWCGQINVLVDIYQQKREARNPDGTKVLEVSDEELKTFLCSNYTDKDGKSLSPHTIATYLKPYRSDKKIDKNSPKRIDISNHFDKNEG